MAKATVTLLGVQVALCFPQYAQADSAIAGASVRITAQPSVLGSLSVFKINIPTTTATAVTIDASPDQNSGSNNFLNFGENQASQPAVFSISGQPDQSFSIVMPQAGISQSAEGSLEFISFQHNAGSTPTIGANGSKVFAVGAQVKFTPFPVLPSGEIQTPDKKLAEQTPAQKDQIPRPNPFGIQGVQDGFLNVLISYN